MLTSVESKDTVTAIQTTAKVSENLPSWVAETIRATEQDTRTQPWRLAFGDQVNCRFDDGKDLLKVEKSVGGTIDPSCPFRTQGSSLAA
jgi:hypothetical protein